MTDAPRLKKSESIEIRLPHPTKQAFMARCQAEGRSASETLRDFIESELAPPPPPPEEPRRRARSWLIGAFATASLAAVAAPSLARPAGGAAFEALDANGDGSVSAREFAALDLDRNGRVTRAEFTRARATPARPGG